MPDSPPAPSLDLATLAQKYQAGALTASTLVSSLLQRLGTYSDPALWIHRLPTEAIEEQAARVDNRRSAGATLPLYGSFFAVKDNIDVAGLPTTAACPAFRYVARHTAPSVARLLEAGAILVGKTNLDQFATGLAGERTPYGVCRNPFDPNVIPGGSSSGSAVAVSAGLVSFSLGTDTAGSGRVPAGCNNIVGLKPTPGSLSTEGVVPACRSLDCVSVFALTVADARAVWEVLREGADSTVSATGVEGFTFAVPRAEDLEFFGDGDQAKLFEDAVGQLEKLGGQRVTVDFAPFREVSDLLYDGPWVAERAAGVGEFCRSHPDEIDPVVRAILETADGYSAKDVFKAMARLDALRPICGRVFQSAEVLVVPTMPTLPTVAEVRADSRTWSRRLGQYTNYANLLGYAALAVPAGFTRRGLPGGITLIGPGGSERRLCELGVRWQRSLNLSLGATGHSLPPIAPPPDAQGVTLSCSAGHVRVAVAGAHLRGQPLHPALLKFGAQFVGAARTAPRYRFVALMDLDPPRPGLVRDEARGGSTLLELYDLPLAGFGALVASVASPLAIGTVELTDGVTVKGFLCEPHAAARARDITDFGGWVAFRDHLAKNGAADNRRSPGVNLSPHSKGRTS